MLRIQKYVKWIGTALHPSKNLKALKMSTCLETMKIKNSFKARYSLSHIWRNDTLERQHGLNQYDFGARWYDPARPGTTTMDPLCEQRPWESPYLWCAGNPVRYADPSGMDIWMIDERGSIQSYEKTMDFDAVRIVDGQGSTILGKDGAPMEIQFDYGMIAALNTAEKGYDAYKISGNTNGTSLFEFLASNTSVEWRQIKLNNNIDYLLTSHSTNETTGIFSLLRNQVLSDCTVSATTINHSHPDGNSFPTGLGEQISDYGDVGAAHGVSLMLNYSPLFGIFVPQNNSYIPYGPNSTVWDFPGSEKGIANKILDTIEIIHKKP